MQRRYEDDHDDRSVCKYERSPATACGVVAAVLALTTQVLASVAIGCCGAWQNPKRANRIAAVVFYVISWYVNNFVTESSISQLLSVFFF